MSAHDSPAHDEDIVGPSDRSFGAVFTAVFTIVALLPLWRGAEPRWWALGIAAVIGILAVVRPRALAPANQVWLRIGLLLHRIVNPIVMGAVYYLVVTPFGIVMRTFRPALTRRMRPDKGAATYWIPREGPSSPMDQQF